MTFNLKSVGVVLSAVLTLAAANASSRDVDDPNQVQKIASSKVRALMALHRIPGMAVGVIAKGKSMVFNYGLAVVQIKQPVTNDTLFEIGSVSKTFTATLVAQAQVNGVLSLSDTVGQHLPLLQGSPFGKLSLLSLGTHTPGGLPLQVPEQVRNMDELMWYLKGWQPTAAAGSIRSYGNLGIGILGLIVAKTAGQDFSELIQQQLLAPLEMKHSFIHVPAALLPNYAMGQTRAGAPIRMASGVLASEAYGMRTTAGDLLRFVQANMGLLPLEDKLQRAINATHTGYYQVAGKLADTVSDNASVKANPMTQDLIWEQYDYPVTLEALLHGNSAEMIFEAVPVTQITLPQQTQRDVWINKTGSTNGFAAYVAFIPSKRMGIVILTNKNFPIGDRVRLAYEILTALQ